MGINRQRSKKEPSIHIIQFAIFSLNDWINLPLRTQQQISSLKHIWSLYPSYFHQMDWIVSVYNLKLYTSEYMNRNKSRLKKSLNIFLVSLEGKRRSKKKTTHPQSITTEWKFNSHQKNSTFPPFFFKFSSPVFDCSHLLILNQQKKKNPLLFCADTNYSKS